MAFGHVLRTYGNMPHDRFLGWTKIPSRTPAGPPKQQICQKTKQKSSGGIEPTTPKTATTDNHGQLRVSRGTWHTGPIYSFYSSLFGVPIVIILTHFFYARKATSNHDPFAFYAFCILRGQFRPSLKEIEANEPKTSSFLCHGALSRFPFYVRKATSNHDPFAFYAFCILRGQFRLTTHACK